MTHTFRSKLTAISLAAAITVTFGANGFAAEKKSSPSPLLSSGRAQVQSLVTTTKQQPAASAQEGVGGYDEPRSFFGTRRGVALLVLAGAGIGYMWYSKSHDRIHSTARARLDN